jgi:CBS domain-containing protein
MVPATRADLAGEGAVLNVASILKNKGDRIVSALPSDSVAAVVTTLGRERIGALLVREASGRVAGVISERDIVAGLARLGAALLQQPAAELMTRNVIYCSPTDTIQMVMQKMTERRFRHMPVLENGKVTGIVSIGDVVKARISETEMEAQSLKEYIATG